MKLNKLAFIVSVVLCISFALAGTFISVNRFYQFDSFYYDFGIFDQAIWRVSQLRAPVIDHYVVGGSWIFGDHFSPALMLLAPIYWVTHAQEAIFFVQAAFAALAGFILHKTSYALTKNSYVSISVQIAFYLFTGLQNAVITDIHELTFATLPLSIVLYSLVTLNKRMYIFSSLFLLLFKESTFLVVCGIHFYTWLKVKEWRNMTITLSMLSIIYAYCIISYVIPAFSNYYQYNFLAGHTVQSVVSALYDHPIKIKTVVDSFTSFSFTAIFTPSLWPTYLVHYWTRFLSSAGSRWEIGLHYNAEIAPIYAFSLMLVLDKLTKNKKTITQLVVVFVVTTVALYQNYARLKMPFLMAINPALYHASDRTVEIRQYLKQMPADPVIMAPNHLAAHLSHKNVRLARDKYTDYDPEYIIFDTNPDQSANNWYGLKDKDQFMKNVSADFDYKLIQSISSYQVYMKN